MKAGDAVNVYAVEPTRGKDKSARIRRHQLWAFRGDATTTEEGLHKFAEDYPFPGFAHIDADGRSALGIPRGAQDAYVPEKKWVSEKDWKNKCKWKDAPSHEYPHGYPVLIAGSWTNTFKREIGVAVLAAVLMFNVSYFVLVSAMGILGSLSKGRVVAFALAGAALFSSVLTGLIAWLTVK